MKALMARIRGNAWLLHLMIRDACEDARQWWRERSQVTITLPQAHGPCVVTIEHAAPGTYTLRIGDQTIELRTHWWDTRASIARKLRRLVGKAMLG